MERRQTTDAEHLECVNTCDGLLYFEHNTCDGLLYFVHNTCDGLLYFVHNTCDGLLYFEHNTCDGLLYFVHNTCDVLLYFVHNTCEQAEFKVGSVGEGRVTYAQYAGCSPIVSTGSAVVRSVAHADNALKYHRELQIIFCQNVACAFVLILSSTTVSCE